MREVYIYLDETGTLDMKKPGPAGKYFGLGQATFWSDPGTKEWEGARLRYKLESEGVHLPKGFHSKDDRESTRDEVFKLIARHKPRLDITLLLKKNAYEPVRRRIEQDEIHLYKQAWILHFKFQLKYLLQPTDKIFVVAASLSEHKKKQAAAREAIVHVLRQFPRHDITLCIWNSPTSWGLQVADYGLWAVQRDIVDGSCRHLRTISPLIETVFQPWEGVSHRPAAHARKTGRPISSLIVGRQPQAARSHAPMSAPRIVKAEPTPVDDAVLDRWDDDPRVEDPLGVGLWGSVPWSDDEPWSSPSDVLRDW